MDQIFEKTGFVAPRFSDFAPSTFKGDTPARRDLIEGRLPRGKLVVLAGAGDVGKSFLLLQLFEAINGGASSEAFGGRVVGKGLPCIAIMGEDDRESVDLRLKSIRSQHNVKPVEHGAILCAPNIGPMGLVTRDFAGVIRPTDALEWLEMQLEALVAQFKQIGFLAIDTLSTLLAIDANKADEVAAAFSMLTSLAARHDVCVIVTHHLRKDNDAGSGADALRAAIRGSSAIVDNARAAYVMNKVGADEAKEIRDELHLDHDGEVVKLAIVKNNLGLRRDPVTYVRMPDGCLRDVSNLLGSRLSIEDAIWRVVREANEAGRKLAKTGEDGLYAQRSPNWPGGLGDTSRKDFEKWANLLIEQGRLRVTNKRLVAVDSAAVASA